MKEPKARKVPIPKKNQTPQEMLVFEIDRALQLLVDTCEKTANNMSGDFVPIDMMKSFKKTLIDNYKEGLKTNHNFK
jgi:hypothetical protein